LFDFLNIDTSPQFSTTIAFVVNLCRDSEALAHAIAESLNIREDLWFTHSIEGRCKAINVFLDTQEALWQQRGLQNAPRILLDRHRIPRQFGKSLGAQYSEDILPPPIMSIPNCHESEYFYSQGQNLS
jgi:hypothetical protein